MRIRSRWANFMRLSGVQKRVLLAAWVALPWVWLGLVLLGLPRLRTLLRRLSPAGRVPVSVSLPDMLAWGVAVNTAARYTPFRATCLTRSLVLEWLLHRRGIASELRIGVRMAGGLLDAHAWVEHEGTPVNDRPDVASQYAPFAAHVALSAFETS